MRSLLLNLLAPRCCELCQTTLSPTEKMLCASCALQLPYTHIRDFQDNSSARLLWGQMNIEKAYSHLYYRHGSPTFQLMMQLKYNQRYDIGRQLGKQIAMQLLHTDFFEGIEAIVPVPLHWTRYLRRGYNQSEGIARGVAQATGLHIDKHIAWRNKRTQKLAKKNAEERNSNMAGVFQARPTPYRHLLLVDDVLTTGATLCHLAQTIAEKNPDIKFSVLTLAKA